MSENVYRTGSWGERPRLPRAAQIIGLVALVLVALMAGLAVGGSRAATPAVRYQTRTLPPGATRFEAGVPVGYSHTQAGMVNAATAYAVTLNGQLLLQKDQLKAAVEAVAAPEYRDQLVGASMANLKALNSAYGIDTNASLGAMPQIEYVPVSYHVESYDDSHARLSIWAVWVIAERGILAPQQNWITSTVEMAWTSSDWKLSSATSHPGPAPLARNGGSDVSSSPLPASMTDYRSYEHVSDTAGGR